MKAVKIRYLNTFVEYLIDTTITKRITEYLNIQNLIINTLFRCGHVWYKNITILKIITKQHNLSVIIKKDQYINLTYKKNNTFLLW